MGIKYFVVGQCNLFSEGQTHLAHDIEKYGLASNDAGSYFLSANYPQPALILVLWDIAVTDHHGVGGTALTK